MQGERRKGRGGGVRRECKGTVSVAPSPFTWTTESLHPKMYTVCWGFVSARTMPRFPTWYSITHLHTGKKKKKKKEKRKS